MTGRMKAIPAVLGLAVIAACADGVPPTETAEVVEGTALPVPAAEAVPAIAETMIVSLDGPGNYITGSGSSDIEVIPDAGVIVQAEGESQDVRADSGPQIVVALDLRPPATLREFANAGESSSPPMALSAVVDAGSGISAQTLPEAEAIAASEIRPVTIPVTYDRSGISDEQDFEAVSSRESIESDALRREQQQAIYKFFEPEEIPERAGQANVARYALTTTNEVGVRIYKRFASRLSQRSLHGRCAEFTDDYAAQQTFLDAGGPEMDKFRLDPDGDGFACGWTPDIFRSLLN